MKIEQLSFLEPIKKPIKKHENKFPIQYDTTICSRCCCNKCKYNVEIYPFLSTEDGKENTPLITNVYFDKEGYWDSENPLKENPLKVCYGGFNKCEVVGNIYENKDLLEG